MRMLYTATNIIYLSLVLLVCSLLCMARKHTISKNSMHGHTALSSDAHTKGNTRAANGEDISLSQLRRKKKLHARPMHAQIAGHATNHGPCNACMQANAIHLCLAFAELLVGMCTFYLSLTHPSQK